MPTENDAIAAAMTDARRCEEHSTAIDSSTAAAATLTKRITVSMFRMTFRPLVRHAYLKTLNHP